MRDANQRSTALATPSSGLLPTVAALTSHERRNYSLQHLVANLAGYGDPGLEHEISSSIAHDLRTTPAHGGVFVPFVMSGLDTRTDGAGGFLVPTRVSSSIVDQLRQHAVCLRAGATLVTGLQSNFQLPTENAVLAANWIQENSGSDCSQSDPSFGVRMLYPHPMQATTAISRQLLRQSSADLSAWLAARIARGHALLLDAACLNGSGSSNQPLGILGTAIGSVAIGGNGGPVAASNLIALESAVGTANGDVGSLAFVTNTLQRSKLRAVPEFAAGTLPLWRDGQMLSYPAFASNQIPSNLVKGTSSNCSAVVFGNWATLLIAEFSGVMELTIDEVTKVRQGEVELTSYAAYDAGLTTPLSMAAIQDAT